MQKDEGTGLESMDDPQGTTQSASITSRLPPPSEEEALLRWAEERLVGPYGVCQGCDGEGLNPYTESTCWVCMGVGETIREDYLEAERALTLAQRQMLGEDQFIQRICSSEVSVFRLAGEDD